jgi:hypothetical protein
MIHSGRAAPKGSVVELRRGEHVIVARVVWRDGARVGLKSDDRLPVEDIMSLTQCQSLRLVADGGAHVERRRRPRAASGDSRLRGRAYEFVGIGVIALALTLGVWAMAQEAFAAPLAKIEAAFGS